MKTFASPRLEPVKESAIRRFIDLASKSKDVSHLEHGEPSFPTPPHIQEAAIKAMRDGFTHYGPTPGLPELRETISKKLVKENKVPVDGPNEVIVTSGTQEGMFLAAMAFLGPGDEALVFDPYYPAYFEETLIAGATPRLAQLTPDSKIRPDQIERQVTSKTRMVWVNSPANPTGHVFSRRDLEEIAAVAERNDLLIFADEVYEKLVYEGAEHVSIGSLPGMEGRVITANGFSKSYAMAGWRVAYLAANKELINQMNKLHYYTVLCASTIAQKAALTALEGDQECVRDMVREYDRRRSATLEELGKMDQVSVARPKGAFYAFPDISALSKDDEAVAETLIRKFSVATVPGSGFGPAGTGHLRLSYSVSLEEVREGLERLRNGLQHLRQ